MARTQKSVVVFPIFPAHSDSKHSSGEDDCRSRGSYLHYLLDLADRLLSRPVEDDATEAA